MAALFDVEEINELVTQLRACPVGPLVDKAPDELQEQMRAMYQSILYQNNIDRYPLEELSDENIAELIERLRARDPQLGVCAEVARAWVSARPYQVQALFRFLQHLLEERTTAADCVLPTGTGKTRVMAAIALIASKFFKPDPSDPSNARYFPVPVITPSKEIAEQNFDDLCNLAVMFERALKQARNDGKIPGPAYNFKVRWVVTQGQLNELRRENTDLEEKATSGVLDQHRQDRLNRLKAILKPTGSRKAVVRLEAFYSSCPDTRVFSCPEVVVYNFHKIIEKEEQKEENGEDLNEIEEEEEEEPFVCESDEDPEEAERHWLDRREKARAKREAARKKEDTDDIDGFKDLMVRDRNDVEFKVLVVDESHRLGTPTIRNAINTHLKNPIVFMLGATPLRLDCEEFFIPREVCYSRPRRWFEDHDYIKRSTLKTFEYKALRAQVANQKIVLYNKEDPQNVADDRSDYLYWHSEEINDRKKSPRVLFPNCDRKFLRSIATSSSVLQEGATLVLRELAQQRSQTGVPHQALIVVPEVQRGFNLVSWLNSQPLSDFGLGHGTGTVRAAMLASKEEELEGDERPARSQGIAKRNAENLQKLQNAQLDVVVVVRMLVEGYNNNLFSVLGLFSPLSDNYLLQYMGRIVRRIDPGTMDRLSHLQHLQGLGFETYTEETLRNDQQAIIVTCADLGLNDIINHDGGMPPVLLQTPSQAASSDPPIISLEMVNGNIRERKKYSIEESMVHILSNSQLPPISYPRNPLPIPEEVLKEIEASMTRLLHQHPNLGVFTNVPWPVMSKDGVQRTSNDVLMAYVAVKESGELPVLTDTFTWSDKFKCLGPFPLGDKRTNGFLRLMGDLGLASVMAGPQGRPTAADEDRNTLFVHGIRGNAKVLVLVPWALQSDTAISSFGGALADFETLGWMKARQRTNASLLRSVFGTENATKLWRKDPRFVTDADLAGSSAGPNGTSGQTRNATEAGLAAAEDGGDADGRRTRARIDTEFDGLIAAATQHALDHPSEVMPAIAAAAVLGDNAIDDEVLAANAPGPSS